MSGFLDILQNKLSLEILSLEDIICDGNYYYFKRIDIGLEQSGQVDFDVRKANLSLKDWISRLRLIVSCPANLVLDPKEDEG
jgi:hypothetical protein